MSLETIEKLLHLHKEWLDSDGRRGQQATYVGTRVPRPNFFTEDNRQVFVPWLVPRDDFSFTAHDLNALRRLHNYSLPPLHLAGSDFRGADFGSINLRDADFSRANLQHCRFTHLNIDGCQFADSDLSECVITNCSSHDTVFDAATVSATRFHNCTFRRVSFAKCTLTDAHFEDCCVEDALFKASMRSATITRILFSKVNLNEAILLGSTIQESTLRHVQMCALQAPQIQMRNVDLNGSVFRDVTVIDCDFSDTRFQGVLMEKTR